MLLARQVCPEIATGIANTARLANSSLTNLKQERHHQSNVICAAKENSQKLSTIKKNG